MMKRWIALILAISLCMTLFACSNQPTTQPTSTNSEKNSSAAPVVTSGIEDDNQERDDNLPAPTEETPERNLSSEAMSTETTSSTAEKKETPDTPSESVQPTAPLKDTESTVPKDNTNTTNPVIPEKQPDATETAPPVEETKPEPTTPPSTYEIEQLVVKYINQYRVAQGSTNATPLQGLTEVARYRAKQLVSNFSHDSIPDACTVLQYGEFIDMTLYGGDESDSYYRGYSKEAIGKGDWFGTADQMAQRISEGFRNSSGHWAYVGDSQYSYIAVGVYYNQADSKWYCCICMSSKNYGD